MSHETAVRRHPAFAICACYLALSVWFCLPLFEHPNAPGINDWDQHLFYYASTMKSVVEYAQLPFWNPWYCGGNVLWANPQVPLLSPVFPLAAVVSLPLAMKINIVLHYWFGLVGMHMLLRTVGVRSLTIAAYLSVAAVLSGSLALHLNVGHSVFLPCLYIPMQLHLVIRGWQEGRVRDVVLAAALLALMIYNGALHAVPMSVAAIGVVSLLVTIAERRGRPLVVGVAVVVLGFALAGPKLLPVVEWVSSDRFVDARTVLERPDQMTVEMLARSYLDRFQHRSLRFDLQRSGWFEYGNYVGVLAAAAMAASVLWTLAAGRGRGRTLGTPLAVASLVLLALSAGEFSPWAPASLATHLPLFSSFRIPSRYTIVFVIVGIAATGWALQQLESEVTFGRGARVWLTLVLVLAAADIVQQNRGQFRNVFPYAPLAEGFHAGNGTRTLVVDTTSDPYAPDAPMLRVLMSGRTFFNCYESLQTRRVAHPDGPLVQAGADARVTSTSFSPNRVEFAAVGGRDRTTVTMNQNLAPGWKSSLGDVTAGEDGRPSVTLAPGQAGRFAFSYAPPGLWPGTGLMVAALLFAAATWRRALPAW